MNGGGESPKRGENARRYEEVLVALSGCEAAISDRITVGARKELRWHGELVQPIIGKLAKG